MPLDLLSIQPHPCSPCPWICSLGMWHPSLWLCSDWHCLWTDLRQSWLPQTQWSCEILPTGRRRRPLLSVGCVQNVHACMYVCVYMCVGVCECVSVNMIQLKGYIEATPPARSCALYMYFPHICKHSLTASALWLTQMWLAKLGTEEIISHIV